MGLNTYPYNPFPASTDKLDEAHNEQIQEEIDQLKSGLTNYTDIASVTADGVKTMSQLLSELYSSIDNISKKQAIYYKNAISTMTQRTTNNAQFGYVANYLGTTYIVTMDITSSSAKVSEISIAIDGTVTATDRSSEVPADGVVISLIR